MDGQGRYRWMSGDDGDGVRDGHALVDVEDEEKAPSWKFFQKSFALPLDILGNVFTPSSHTEVGVTNVSLIEEMKERLPIPVHPSPGLCQVLQSNGVEASPDTELMVMVVIDSGEKLYGITCHVVDKAGQIDEDEEAFVVSLTHLRVKEGHPLSQKIKAYQKKREFMLQVQRMNFAY